jgi:putative nucleotidyltransferase with HDIG domain
MNPKCLPEDNTAVRLSLAGLLSALSCALDLTEGQPMGHCLRACLIALRLAETIGLPEDERDTLHLVMLLKDSGCASNAGKMFSLFGGDERIAKRDGKISDWCNSCESVKFAFRNALPGGSLRERLAVLQKLARVPERVMDVLTIERCTEGAEIARLLGLSETVAAAIYCLDEHWDAKGAPHHLRGEAIPLLARIACLAQTMEVYATTYSVSHAYAIARKRSGKWFDPKLVHAAKSFEKDREFWSAVAEQPEAFLDRITGASLQNRITEASLDSVCKAFARIVDSKSSFTAAHSARVAFYADHIAVAMGMETEERLELRRAALLHDIGKLGVPNQILDKPGSLTEREIVIIQRHPLYTAQVLRRIPSFEKITAIAAAHHEKLDGSGYSTGLSAPVLTPQMRLLTVSDIFDALTAERPYRTAMPPDQAVKLLEADATRGRIDADCVIALKESVPVIEEQGTLAPFSQHLGIMSP